MVGLGLLVFDCIVTYPGIRFRLPVYYFTVGSSVPSVGLIVIIESLSYLSPVRNLVGSILLKEREDFFKAFGKFRLRRFRSSVKLLIYLFLYVLKDDFFLTALTRVYAHTIVERRFLFIYFFLFYRGCRGIVFFFFVLFFF